MREWRAAVRGTSTALGPSSIADNKLRDGLLAGHWHHLAEEEAVELLETDASTDLDTFVVVGAPSGAVSPMQVAEISAG